MDQFLGLDDEEPDSWTPTVNKKVLSTLNEKEIKRQEHIYELILTEKHHCITLTVMQKVFVEGLKKDFNFDADVDRMFPNLPHLIEIHINFLRRLRERQREKPVVNFIGDIILEQFSGNLAEKLKTAYGIFCSKHREAIDVYKYYLQNDENFASFVRRCQSNPILKKKGIPECILFVTQRLTKYPLLLEPLIRSSKDNKEELRRLTNALSLIKNILVEVDTTIAKKEEEGRMVEVLQKIDTKSFTFYNGEKFTKSRLLSYKHLRFEGEALLVCDCSKIQMVLVVILSDILVFFTESNGLLNFFSPDSKEGVISLNKLLVREKAGGDEKGIYLISSSFPSPTIYELRISKPKDKQHWIQSIRNAAKTVCSAPSGKISGSDMSRVNVNPFRTSDEDFNTSLNVSTGSNDRSKTDLTVDSRYDHRYSDSSMSDTSFNFNKTKPHIRVDDYDENSDCNEGDDSSSFCTDEYCNCSCSDCSDEDEDYDNIGDDLYSTGRIVGKSVIHGRNDYYNSIYNLNKREARLTSRNKSDFNTDIRNNNNFTFEEASITNYIPPPPQYREYSHNSEYKHVVACHGETEDDNANERSNNNMGSITESDGNSGISSGVVNVTERISEDFANNNPFKDKYANSSIAKNGLFRQIEEEMIRKDKELSQLLSEKLSLQRKLLPDEFNTRMNFIASSKPVDSVYNEIARCFNNVNQLLRAFEHVDKRHRIKHRLGLEHVEQPFIGSEMRRLNENMDDIFRNVQVQNSFSSVPVLNDFSSHRIQKMISASILQNQKLWNMFLLSYCPDGTLNVKDINLSAGKISQPVIDLGCDVYGLISIISKQLTLIASLKMQLDLHIAEFHVLQSKNTLEKRPEYLHNQQLEELRNLQDRFAQEKMNWQQQKDVEQKELELEKQQILQLKQQIMNEQNDVMQQREKLYRKIESLSSQGLLNNAGTEIIDFQAPTQSSMDLPFSQFEPRSEIGKKQQLPPKESVLPANLLSATNQSKVSSKNSMKVVRQTLPLKLAKGLKSGEDLNTSVNNPVIASTSNRKQILPLKLLENADTESDKKHSNSNRAVSNNTVHLRTGSSPAMMQNIQVDRAARDNGRMSLQKNHSKDVENPRDVNKEKITFL